MNETIIRWTDSSWNPVSGCSKVSDGCRFCYAMTISLKFKQTSKPWTIQNEAENVVIKPHKLHEPYTLGTEPQRCFVNSMSDLFHRVIPDWYRAAVFCVMLDLPHIIFQTLTKRSDATIDWHERFLAAVRSDEFKAFAATVKHKKVQAALAKAETYTTPWGANIWQGVSVEDARVLSRIDDLRQCHAAVRFISAEPLLGAWGNTVDLSGIHWIIVGGESGKHINEHPERYMKQEWAREIKNLCVDQGVAYFYKRDSGYRTEQRKYLVEEDGSMWEWQQYPGMLIPPRELGNPESLFGNWDHKTEDTSFNLRSYIAHLWESRAYQLDGIRAENAAIAAAWWYKALEELRPALPLPPLREFAMMTPDGLVRGTAEELAAMKTPSVEPLIADLPAAVEVTPLAPKPAVTWDTLTDPPAKTTVVNFRDVSTHWNRGTRAWDDPTYVYIGRYNPTHNLPGHLLANPFKLDTDTPEARAKALDQYREMLTARLADPIDGPKYRAALDSLKGKTCVCWCAPQACHGHVIQEFLGEASDKPKAEQHVEPPKPEAPPVQMSMFDLKTYV